MTFEMIDGDLGATEDGTPREIIFRRADGTFVCTREGGGNVAWSTDAPDGELMFFELLDMHGGGMVDGKVIYHRLIIRRVFPCLVTEAPADEDAHGKEAGDDKAE